MSYCQTTQDILTEDIRSCLLPNNPDRPKHHTHNITAMAQVLAEYTADHVPYNNMEETLEAILTMITKATLIRAELIHRGANPDVRQ